MRHDVILLSNLFQKRQERTNHRGRSRPKVFLRRLSAVRSWARYWRGTLRQIASACVYSYLDRYSLSLYLLLFSLGVFFFRALLFLEIRSTSPDVNAKFGRDTPYILLLLSTTCRVCLCVLLVSKSRRIKRTQQKEGIPFSDDVLRE